MFLIGFLPSLNREKRYSCLAVGWKHSLRVGWRNFFYSCQFLVQAGNRFWFYILYVLRILQLSVVLCQFFGSGGKYFFVLRKYLVYDTVSCAVVLVFGLWREIVLKMRTPFYKKILLGYFFMIRQPMSVFYDLTLFYSVISLYLGLNMYTE